MRLKLASTTFCASALLSSACVISIADDVAEDVGDGPTEDGDTETGGDECRPVGGATFSYVFNWEELEPFQSDLEATCEVLTADVADGLALSLNCEGATAPVTISVTASPTFTAPVEVGDLVSIHYVFDGPWWFNSHLRLDVQGQGHLLTIIDGDALNPPEQYGFAPPLELSRVYDQCSWEDGFCGQVERLSLAVGGGDEAVFDGNFEVVGDDPGTALWVDTAELLHEVDCTDTPDEWFRLLIVNSGGE